MYEIFCDGATSGNGKADAPGGWAYVILKDGRLVSQNSGGEKGTTNQRMELTAALKACKEIDAMDEKQLYTVLAQLSKSSAKEYTPKGKQKLLQQPLR